MTASTEIRSRAIALVEQLPEQTLAKAVDFLEALCKEASQANQVTVVAPLEEALLQIIGRRLPPEDQTRLTYLRQRNETEQITEKELTELLAYVERVEHQDAQRAEALIKLSQLRNVELKTLLNEFTPSNGKINAI